MPIAVVCPGCSAKLNAPDTAAGKKVKCPKCQGAITIPAPQSDFEEVEDEPVAPVKKPAPKPAAKPPVKAAVEVDEDEDEEVEKPKKKPKKAASEDEEDEKPKKKKKKKAAAEGGSSLARNLIGGVVLLILLGVVAFVFYDKFGKKKQEVVEAPKDNDPPVVTPGPKKVDPVNPSGPPSGWVELAPVGGGYRILTEKGQNTTEDAEGRKNAAGTVVSVAEKRSTLWSPTGKNTFQMVVFYLPPSLPATERADAFDEIHRQWLDGVSEKEEAPKPVTWGGRPAFEAEVKNVIGGHGLRRWVIGDTTAYLATVWGDRKRATPAIEKAYFDSFSIAGTPAVPKVGEPVSPTPADIPPTPADTRQWQPHTADDGSCRLKFPNTGRRIAKSTTLDKLKVEGELHTATGGEKGREVQAELYYLGYLLYPAGASADDKKRLQDQLGEEMSGYAKGAKITRRQVTVGKHTWEEAQRARDGSFGVKGGAVLRTLEVGDRLYFMLATRSDSLPPADMQKRYFESFELLK